MFKNKPVTLIIASVLMVVLIVLTGVFQVFGGGRGIGMNGARPGDFQPGSLPQGGAFPQGEIPSDGTRPQDGNFQPGSMPPDGSGFKGSRDGNAFGSDVSMKLMQLLRGIQTGAAILIMILGILSIVGMLLTQKWGRILAIVTSILVALAAIPSLIQMRFGANLIANLVEIALAVAVIVLCFLPKSRQAVVTA